MRNTPASFALTVARPAAVPTTMPASMPASVPTRVRSRGRGPVAVAMIVAVRRVCAVLAVTVSAVAAVMTGAGVVLAAALAHRRCHLLLALADLADGARVVVVAEVIRHREYAVGHRPQNFPHLAFAVFHRQARRRAVQRRRYLAQRHLLLRVHLVGKNGLVKCTIM
jgi:hypothetical protein